MRERIGAAGWLLVAAARVQLRDMRGNQAALMTAVVLPVVLVLLLVTRDPDGSTSAGLTVGVVLTSVWGSAVWTAGGVLRREIGQRTLAANIVSPQPGGLVLFGKSLGAMARTVVTVLVSVTAALLALGVHVPLARPALLVIGLLLTLAAAAVLGMGLACLFVLTPYARQISGAVLYPVYLCGGMLVPVDLLPPGLRQLSALVPLRWAQEFLASSAVGEPRWPALALLVVLTAGYGVLTTVCFGAVVRRARKRGDLAIG